MKRIVRIGCMGMVSWVGGPEGVNVTGQESAGRGERTERAGERVAEINLTLVHH